MTKRQLETRVEELEGELSERLAPVALRELQESLQTERDHAWKLIEYIQGMAI